MWSFGYVGYLLSSLKFNFQRAEGEAAERLSNEFFKVLEKSKIRQTYDGVVYQNIWNMMQPNAEERSSWEEILQDEDLEEVVKKVEAKYPGIIERAMKKERLYLKDLIPLNQDMETIGKQLVSVYGKFISDDGVLMDFLMKYTSYWPTPNK